jgi:hypothetical protein
MDGRMVDQTFGGQLIGEREDLKYFPKRYHLNLFSGMHTQTVAITGEIFDGLQQIWETGK